MKGLRKSTCQEMDRNEKKFQSVGKLVLENYPFLKRLSRTKSEDKRESLLRSASRNELLSLVDICHNILKSNFTLSSKQKSKLLPFADIVRKFARIRSERGARKIIKNQKGRGALFTTLLAPVLLEAGRQLISKIIENPNSDK